MRAESSYPWLVIALFLGEGAAWCCMASEMLSVKGAGQSWVVCGNFGSPQTRTPTVFVVVWLLSWYVVFLVRAGRVVGSVRWG